MGFVTLRRRRIWSFRSVVSSLPPFCLRMFLVLTMVASGHRGVGEGPVAKDCVCGCVCHVQLFVDYWPDCKAFQPHACMPACLFNRTKTNALVIVTERNVRVCSYRQEVSLCFGTSQPSPTHLSVLGRVTVMAILRRGTSALPRLFFFLGLALTSSCLRLMLKTSSWGSHSRSDQRAWRMLTFCCLR